MQPPVMRAQEVADILEISKDYAYVIIRQFNEEMKAKGYYTQAGRISRKYFEERTGLSTERVSE